MSDTDHTRPNRREIMAELAQATRKYNQAVYEGDKARAERDAAEKQVEDAEADLRTERATRLVREARVERLAGILLEACSWLRQCDAHGAKAFADHLDALSISPSAPACSE